MIARKRLNVVLTKEARYDIQKMSPEGREGAMDALGDLQAHPMAGELKTGKLVGSRSWDFHASAEDEKPSGRIVYVIQQHEIKIFAVHPDHDEAYKRARSRAARYL